MLRARKNNIIEQVYCNSCYKQGPGISCGIAICASFLRFFYNINLDEKFFTLKNHKNISHLSLVHIVNISSYPINQLEFILYDNRDFDSKFSGYALSIIWKR